MPMYITHRWLSIVEGCVLVALGIKLLSASQLLISGTAGLGLILIQVTDLSFGQLFFVLNLPFYLLSLYALGWQFTLRTFISVSLLTGLTELLDRFVTLQIGEPVLAAVMGGLLLGFGLIILFRHQASLGGFNIMAIFMERRFGIHAGKTTLALDLTVLVLGLCLLEPSKVIWSLFGFVALSSVMGRYHNPPAWARPQAAESRTPTPVAAKR